MIFPLLPGEGRGPGGLQPWTPAFAGEHKRFKDNA
jgi:hypothetical protein